MLTLCDFPRYSDKEPERRGVNGERVNRNSFEYEKYLMMGKWEGGGAIILSPVTQKSEVCRQK